MEPDLHARIEHDFTNHASADEVVIARFETLREAAKTLGHVIVDNCPNSREKSLAITNLEQALMYAVAAVARNQELI